LPPPPPPHRHWLPVHPSTRPPLNSLSPTAPSLNRMFLPSNRPLKTHLLGQKKSMSDTASYPMQCLLTLQYRAFILHSIFFHLALYTFSWCNLSCIPYTFFCSNISPMTSVTKVTRVRFCKV
jgi:hypothetical protein